MGQQLYASTSNVPLALGQDAFVEQARGIVRNLRRLHEGIIVPVDFAAHISSHRDLQCLHEQLVDWPDQELVSFLVEGVRYKADVDFQIVLLPHLISLKDGYISLLKEVDKHAKAGWYGLFSHPPFLPFRAVPKGSVPHKLEAGWLATDCLFKNGGAATKSCMVSTTNSNSIRSIGGWASCSKTLLCSITYLHCYSDLP